MSGGFGERIIMVCQACRSNHHEGQKEVLIQDDRTGTYRKAVCPLCVCLDCVQTGDDPIRKHLRPLMMGQTLQTQYNLNVDEFKPGQTPTKRNIHIKAPGQLNVPEALKAMGNLMGLEPPAPPPRHNIGQAVACGCGKNATSRCISCNVPLCVKCLKSHECEG
jgi:hypothetical protein